MNIWERRIIGTLTLGGSFLGLVLWLMLAVGQSQLLAKILSAPFALGYLWGLWCGIQLLEGNGRGLRQSTWFWVIQIPTFSSPVLGYLFTSGAYVTVTYLPATSSFNWMMTLGSKFECSLMQADKPWMFGINFIAIVVASLLFWRFRNAHLAAATETSATAATA